MSKLLLLVDPGDGTPVVRKSFGSDEHRARKYAGRMQLVAIERWWLVRCENADAGRGTIQVLLNPPPVGEAFSTDFPLGEICAFGSGG